MSDENAPVPERSYWSRLERRHRVAVGAFGAAIVLAAVVGGVAWWAATRELPEREGGGLVTGAPQTGDATGSAATSGSGNATFSASATRPASATWGAATASATQPPAYRRTPYVAFRISGALWVAREDGTEAAKVLDAAPDLYALSPDAKTVAAIDEARAELLLIDVRTHAVKRVAGAIPAARPSWLRDSAWLAYTGSAPSPYARRIRRDGTGGQVVMADALSPQFSPDGASIAYLHVKAPGNAALYVMPVDGTSAKLVADSVLEFCWADPAGFYYATVPRLRPAELWATAADGTQKRKLETYSGERPAAFTDLHSHPSGTDLVYAETGDDGYSRMSTIRWDGSGRRALSVRRDDYPIGWTVDGSAVLFIEGNALQGEATTLMSVRPDGTGRRALLDGAGL